MTTYRLKWTTLFLTSGSLTFVLFAVTPVRAEKFSETG